MAFSDVILVQHTLLVSPFTMASRLLRHPCELRSRWRYRGTPGNAGQSLLPADDQHGKVFQSRSQRLRRLRSRTQELLDSRPVSSNIVQHLEGQPSRYVEFSDRQAGNNNNCSINVAVNMWEDQRTPVSEAQPSSSRYDIRQQRWQPNPTVKPVSLTAKRSLVPVKQTTNGPFRGHHIFQKENYRYTFIFV